MLLLHVRINGTALVFLPFSSFLSSLFVRFERGEQEEKGKKEKQFDMETIEFSTVENSGTTVNHGFNPSFLIHLFPVNHLFARSFPLSSGASIGVNLLFDRRATLSRLISEREATPLLPTDPTRSIKHSCRWPRARVPTP